MTSGRSAESRVWGNIVILVLAAGVTAAGFLHRRDRAASPRESGDVMLPPLPPTSERPSFPWMASALALLAAASATFIAYPLMSRSLPLSTEPDTAFVIDVTGVGAINANLMYTVGATREDSRATSNRLQIMLDEIPTAGPVTISLVDSAPQAGMACYRVERTDDLDLDSPVGIGMRVLHELPVVESGPDVGWTEAVAAGDNVRITCTLASAFSWTAELGTRYIAVPSIRILRHGEVDPAPSEPGSPFDCVILIAPSLATTGYASTSSQTSDTCIELARGSTRSSDGETRPASLSSPYLESIDVPPERTARESRTFWAGLSYGFAAALLAPAAGWVDLRLRTKRQV